MVPEKNQEFDKLLILPQDQLRDCSILKQDLAPQTV